MRKPSTPLSAKPYRRQQPCPRPPSRKVTVDTRPRILDNVTLYWLANTAISSARLYWDNAHFPSCGFFDPRGIKIPVAVSAFPDEIYQAPQSWAEKAYPKLIHYARLLVSAQN